MISVYLIKSRCRILLRVQKPPLSLLLITINPRNNQYSDLYHDVLISLILNSNQMEIYNVCFLLLASFTKYYYYDIHLMLSMTVPIMGSFCLLYVAQFSLTQSNVGRHLEHVRFWLLWIMPLCVLFYKFLGAFWFHTYLVKKLLNDRAGVCSAFVDTEKQYSIADVLLYISTNSAQNV